MKPTIYFRADGNSQIGLGHVVRSLALAGMIKEGFECKFIIRDPSPEIKKQILEVCSEIIELKSGIAGEAELIAAKYISKNDITVLDGYHFDTQYQKVFKERGTKLVCIDDLHQIHFVADAVINHAYGIEREDYKAEFYTRFYLGPEYALLRLPFLVATKEHRTVSKTENLFISLGGSDPQNCTLSIIKGIINFDRIKRIDVVLGSGYLYFETLKEFKGNTKINFHKNLNAKEICALMKDSDIGICSASTVSYEYCSVGGLLFIVKTASNQEKLYDFLLNEKLGLDFKGFEKNYTSEAGYFIDVQKKYFNGESAKNIQKIFRSLALEDEILIRKALKEDIKLYFEWANDPLTRNNSINKQPIKWEDHGKWFYEKLTDKNTYLFLFSIQNNLFGQLRFDKMKDYWLINFSVDKNYRGRGLAESLVHKGIVELKQIINCPFILKAQVLDQNTASANIFKKLNFKIEDPQIINSEKFNNFIKHVD
ncbi:MAG TPA: UDP-2,4-diacetamido-2,4,6-trideoxy-beta-L-altropyranose hydrolase [Cytophagaceae bacterium]|nr:UDP-2,4-diacetamido-2,4,6-trideoxy-beta-L-altropyranose hydrolase [Cytophagaceae bacterium]